MRENRALPVEKNKVYCKVNHYCRSAACEHRVMITGSINHCQPQLILSYLFLFCSIQVSRNVWQPSSLGRAKDQTVLLFIDRKLHLHSLRASQSLQLWDSSSLKQLGCFLEHFGAFQGLAREVSLFLALGKWGELCLSHRNSTVKCLSENTEVSNPESGQNNEIVVTALTVCVPCISGWEVGEPAGMWWVIIPGRQFWGKWRARPNPCPYLG